jgi:hypothetical protein
LTYYLFNQNNAPPPAETSTIGEALSGQNPNPNEINLEKIDTVARSLLH